MSTRRMALWYRVPCLIVALLAVTPIAGLAQPAGGGTRDATSDIAESRAERTLRREVLARFRALPVSNGVVLVPVTRRPGIDNIELRDGTIAVNGTVVTGAELRQRLGDQADAVIALSYLDGGAQQRLLGVAPARPAAPGERAAEETAAPSSAAEPEESQSEEAARAREAEASARAREAEASERAGEAETSTAAERAGRTFRRVSHGRVRIGGPITVESDEDVRGGVVAILGSVEIDGRVRDEVVAVGGDVRLGPHADIDGDVTIVGGLLVRDPDARVRGQVNEVDLAVPRLRFRPVGPWSVHVTPWWGSGAWRAVQLFGTLGRVALFALLAALILLLVPQRVDRIEYAICHEPWKAALIGFFAQLLFVPIVIVTVLLLVVSIIGIPLLVLVPFGILAFVIAFFVGFTASARATGALARGRGRWPVPSAFALLFLGLLIIWALTLVGRFVTIAGGPFVVLGGALLLAGFLVEYAAWTVGLGGTLMTRFGGRGPVFEPPPPPVPPDLDPLADLEPPRTPEPSPEQRTE